MHACVYIYSYTYLHIYIYTLYTYMYTCTHACVRGRERADRWTDVRGRSRSEWPESAQTRPRTGSYVSLIASGLYVPFAKAGAGTHSDGRSTAVVRRFTTSIECRDIGMHTCGKVSNLSKIRTRRRTRVHVTCRGDIYIYIYIYIYIDR